MTGCRAPVWLGLILWPAIACLAEAPDGRQVPPVLPAGEQVLYPAAMQGYWQGTLEVGDQHPGRPGRRFTVQLVYIYGRRLAPPDTTLAADHRHAVVWETVSAEASSQGTGRFCEVLSFNSRAKVELSDDAGRVDETEGARAQIVHTSGRICGMYNRTGAELRLAWSTRGDGSYPESFEPTADTQVATLSLLSEDVYPPELEGQWQGAQLLAKERAGTPGIVQGTETVELTCSAGRCIYSGPAGPNAVLPEPTITVTDVIFFQKTGNNQGKFCEFVSFSNTSAVAAQHGRTHGQVQHGVDVHCNIYRRVGDSLVVAWGSDPAGAAPESLKPSPTSMVATLDLQPSSNIITEVQGRWTGHVRERVLIPGTNATQVRTQGVSMTCLFAHCVASTQQQGDAQTASSVKVLTTVKAEGTGFYSGRFCEMLTGATAGEASGLRLSGDRNWEELQATRPARTLSSVGRRLLRPAWDHLGQVRCSIFKRQGSVLKIASYVGDGFSETYPEDFVPLLGKISSATFILDEGRPSAPIGLAEGPVDDASLLDSSSPLSVFLAIDGPGRDALPPIDVSGGYSLAAGLGPTRSTKTPRERPDETETQQPTQTLSSLTAPTPPNVASGLAHTGSVLGSMHKQLGLASRTAPTEQQPEGERNAAASSSSSASKFLTPRVSSGPLLMAVGVAMALLL